MAFLYLHGVRSGSGKGRVCRERFMNAGVWPDQRPQAWQLKEGQGQGGPQRECYFSYTPETNYNAL